MRTLDACTGSVASESGTASGSACGAAGVSRARSAMGSSPGPGSVPAPGMRIVYNSFEGRFSDSTRVLFEALRRELPGAEHVWLQDPVHTDGFPAEVATVPYEPEAAAAALEGAALVVANTHIDLPWRMRSDTRYLQTWHGTPLKRIHHDVLWAPEGRLSDLDRDVARWDVLLSPNAPSSPRLRKAFGFDGTILETGYPRNDLLSSARADTVRTTVRETLGVAPDVKVILYAPTWRDDECLLDLQKPVPFGLDVPRFMELLGPGHELL